MNTVLRGRHAWLMAAAAIVASAGVGRTAAQSKPAAEPLEVVQIRPNFYMIAGDGANVAVQVGPDGAVVVDTGSGARAEQVVAEIRKLTNRPVRYIINTSADRDHVGGNDAVSKAGQSVIPTGGLNEIGAAGGRAPILADENVQSRMAVPTALRFRESSTSLIDHNGYMMLMRSFGLNWFSTNRARISRARMLFSSRTW